MNWISDVTKNIPVRFKLYVGWQEPYPKILTFYPQKTLSEIASKYELLFLDD